MGQIKKFMHRVVAWLAYWYYGRPSREIVVIGVTGTKGKSTTSRLIASVLEKGGYKVGLLSTVEFQIGEKRWLNDKKMTMLGKGQIQKMLKQMVKAGCSHVVVETSSEGILQYRHYGLNYDVAVFTNLGSEHAERHGGYDNLRADKGKLFASLKCAHKKEVDGAVVPKTIVANGDDVEAKYYLSFMADKKVAFSFNKNKFDNAENIFAEKIAEDDRSFKIGSELYSLKILGGFNVYNGLAAVAVGKIFGISYDKIYAGLSSVDLVPGRMEFIEEGQNFKVVVDYAHEPMSLAALFSSLRKLTTGKVIGVIGSDGGGRDKLKRSKMGRVSAENADILVITDVNCYDEDPTQIAEMLVEGAKEGGKVKDKDMFVEIDRRKAIELAFSKASPGDIVAITAKGTEPYIGVANGKKIPWDDRLVSREILKEKYVQKKESAA